MLAHLHRFTPRAAAIALLLALLAPIAVAKPAETEKSRSPFAGDARLEKRVTLTYPKIPLSEALAEVTKQTGVKLVALDRAADEPVALFIKEQPAGEVLRQIAELLGYYWSRRGAGVRGQGSGVGKDRSLPTPDPQPPTPSYEIFQDVRSKQEEDAILSGARRAVIETLQAELRRHRRFADLPPDELKKRVEAGNADLARMMGQGGGGFGGPGQPSDKMHEWQAARNVSEPLGRVLLGVVERLTPEQWQSLVAAEPIIYSTDPKPGELRLPNEIVTALKDTKPMSPLPPGIAQNLGPDIQEQLRKVEQMTAEEWSRATGYRVDVQLTLSMGSQPVGLLRVAPQPLGGTRGLSALNGLNVFAMPNLQPPHDAETPEARKERLARDPVLARKGHPLPPGRPDETAAFLPFLKRSGELLRRMAECYDINIVADAYTSGSIAFGGMAAAQATPGAEGSEKEALYESLDRSFGFQRVWVRDGDFIRLRSANWAFDRNLEIPSRLMRGWAADWKARDGWDLDQLAAVVDALRPEQVMTFELAAQEYQIPSGGQLFTLMLSADALRLYAHLQTAQRQTLLAGKPLGLASLAPDQRAYALNLARGRSRSVISMFMGPPPWRSLQSVLGSTFSLIGAPAQPMPFGPMPLGNAGTPKPAGGAPPAPHMMAIFQLRFPEGPPESYVVPGVLPPGTSLPKAAAAEKP